MQVREHPIVNDAQKGCQLWPIGHVPRQIGGTGKLGSGSKRRRKMMKQKESRVRTGQMKCDSS